MASGITDTAELKWVTLFDNEPVKKEEKVKPAKLKAAAKKPAAKKTKKENDASSFPEISDLPSPGPAGDIKSPSNKKRLSVERIYQKKTQLEHILLRPDTYIGSVEPVTTSMWLYDDVAETMVQREITYVPGLYKIFDEILVNAADNKQRDKNMNCIKIDINPDANKIKIWNNGKGIPVTEHKTEKMYVPTLIFGHLLTSSNYNDEERKVTGGRNGYGAKLCNIFSTKFTVETSARQYKKKFKQTWKNNMVKVGEVGLKDHDENDFTSITFEPDLSKFKMEKLDKDIVDLFTRRAYDIAAASKGVKVFLNGKRLPVKNFVDYVHLFTKDKTDETGSPLKIVHQQVNDRWEVAVTMSEKGFQQASFVNSIATTKGGRHTDYVTDQIVTKLQESIKKKGGKNSMTMKPFQIKSHLWVFVNCLIENPTFDSQTKENMTLQAKNFGSKCVFNDKFMQGVAKCGIVENIMSWMKFKAQAQLQKKCHGSKHSKLKGIPKLDDANDAGTKNSSQCTLILTEGDSAKTLAVAGLGVIGRDHYGVFPLKGKVLNVREASHKQIMENAEVNNIIKILGLQYKNSYDSPESLRSLRYGKLMIMTDQDQDGSHIKGLLINFLHHNWPGLLKHNFLEEFITPIVKVTKGRTEQSFYSLPEFEEWKKNTGNWHTYKVKYYKGLGTSTGKEAKEYFADMKRHRIPFKYAGSQDDSSIVLAFSKKKIEERKDWLRNWMEERKRRSEMGLPEIYIYGKETKYLTYNEFINRELVLFSNMDNERSIPSLCDGLKPGQRKVLFTCFKRNLVKELKVVQLAGSVAEMSAYHHGEGSLMGTIIGLAQNFVGSNNINLMQPIGQFGTRLHGGKDAASPRYIFTALSPLTQILFNKSDEALYKDTYDDNQKIEPEWYLPIIPMVLVNGAQGIGTGWSTNIPNYDPREIVSNIRRMLDDEDPLPMLPAYKDFKGTIEELEEQRYVINGEIAVIDDTTVEITELPIRSWTQAYKESVLEPMLYGSEKVPPVITDYKEYHTDTTVKFVIKMNPDKLLQAEEKGLHNFFKIQTTLTTSSMVLFDNMGVLKKYNSPQEILKEFYYIRLDYYQRRKDYLEGMLAAESLKLDNQARFICEKIEGKIKIENLPKKEIIQLLVRRGYDSDPVKAWKEAQNKQDDADNDTDDEQSEMSAMTGGGPDFNYILNLPMWSLTKERKEDLLRQRDNKADELETLRGKDRCDLWKEDLDKFSVELDRVETQEKEDNQGAVMTAPKSGKGRMKPKLAAQETKPSPMGRRVQPRIDPRLKKVAQGEAAKRGRKVKQEEDQGKLDDYGFMNDSESKADSEEPMSLADRLGLNKDTKIKKETKPKAAKQSKLDFKPKKKVSPKKKRNPWSDSEDEDNISDIESDTDMEVVPRERGPRRAVAAKPKKFNFSDDEDELKIDDDSDDDFDISDSGDDSWIAASKGKSVAKKQTVTIIDSDDEDVNNDIEVESNAPSSQSVDNSEPLVIAEKPAPSKTAPKKKALGKKPAAPKKALGDSKQPSIFAAISKACSTPKPVNPASQNALGTASDNEDVRMLIQPSSPVTVKKAPAMKKDDDKPKKPKAAPVKRKKKVDDSEDEKPKKKAPKKIYVDSDDSDEDFGTMKKSTAAKKNKPASDSESDFDASPVQPRATTGRARAAVKYNFGDDDDSDNDF